MKSSNTLKPDATRRLVQAQAHKDLRAGFAIESVKEKPALAIIFGYAVNDGSDQKGGMFVQSLRWQMKP